MLSISFSATAPNAKRFRINVKTGGEFPKRPLMLRGKLTGQFCHYEGAFPSVGGGFGGPGDARRGRLMRCGGRKRPVVD